MKKKCRYCKKQFLGRTDKLFCAVKCKNKYHLRLRQVTNDSTKNIDAILHRNRSILLEILGKNGVYKKFHRTILDKKNFNFNYVTSYHVNNKGKTVNHVYDFSWLTFSDDEVLVRRKKGI